MNLLNLAQGFIGGLTVATAMWHIVKVRLDRLEKDFFDIRRHVMSISTCDEAKAGYHRRLDRLEVSVDKLSSQISDLLREVD